MSTVHPPADAAARDHQGSGRSSHHVPDPLGLGDLDFGMGDHPLQAGPRKTLFPDSSRPVAEGEDVGIKRRVGGASGAAIRHEQGEIELLAAGAMHRGDSSSDSTPLAPQQMVGNPHTRFPVHEARLPSRADDPGRADAEPPQSPEFGNPHFEFLQSRGLGLGTPPPPARKTHPEGLHPPFIDDAEGGPPLRKLIAQGIGGGSADAFGLRELLLIRLQALPNLDDGVAKLFDDMVVRTGHFAGDVIDIDGEDYRGVGKEGSIDDPDEHHSHLRSRCARACRYPTKSVDFNGDDGAYANHSCKLVRGDRQAEHPERVP